MSKHGLMTASGGCHCTIAPFSSVTPTRMNWLWSYRIPRGKITVLGGNPDCGKSLVSIDIVARATTGRGYPGDEAQREAISALMLFCEDGAADTVKPRLMAAGADIPRVYFFDGEFHLDAHLPWLREALLAKPDIKLVVIDPISNYLGSANSEKEKEVRKALIPLARLAEELDVTFLPIMHFNKRGDVNALHRIMGAVAFSGVARAVWLFADDPDNENQYLMLRGKLNVAKKLFNEGLQYAIEETSVDIAGEPTGQPIIVWKGSSKVTAERAIGYGASQSGTEKLIEACAWLKDFLKTEKPAREVYEEAKQQGISKRTLERAKRKLDVESEQTSDGWHWHLPEPPGVPEIEEAQAANPDRQAASYGGVAV